jgi:hypothetical protein
MKLVLKQRPEFAHRKRLVSKKVPVARSSIAGVKTNVPNAFVTTHETVVQPASRTLGAT